MLEKIGLPPKPSLRGNNWVVDASHCQGCSSQFTLINRKHHCRRCGGIFCGSCTQQRMFLRGQGDSPVRICDPCKNLEDAARFEMRHRNKGRASKGNSGLASKKEEDILNEILGTKDNQFSTENIIGGPSSIIQEALTHVEGGSSERSVSMDQPSMIEAESDSPEKLREQALAEKKKYKVLKSEGKSEEAMRAYKRGKEIERQAAALEISLRKNRRKVLSSNNMDDKQEIGDHVGATSEKAKLPKEKSKASDDLSAELKELGWSELDLRDADKKSANLSLEGELSSLLREVSTKPNKEKPVASLDKSQVIAHKKKALEMKRAGNLAEAKEELKKAKILERKIEEEELLDGADDSDDELSLLIRSMDADEGDVSSTYKSDFGFNVDFLDVPNDFGTDGNLEVTDEDMEDPEMASALRSLGWAEEKAYSEDFHGLPASNRESSVEKIQSLKREAVGQKRAGNTAEAMALLKKAKQLEMQLESFDTQDPHIGIKSAPKSKATIQKELIALKKKILLLKREGRLDEWEEELKKAMVLEAQLENLDKSSISVQSSTGNIWQSHEMGDVDEEEVQDPVTDQDMRDPSYLSLLKNLGWEDEDDGKVNSAALEESYKATPVVSRDNSVAVENSSVSSIPQVLPGKRHRTPRKSKSEIQRELLTLKRRALALRREGQTDAADELLNDARSLEEQLQEYEDPTIKEVSSANEGGIDLLDAIQSTKSSLQADMSEDRLEDMRKVTLEIPEEKMSRDSENLHHHETDSSQGSDSLPQFNSQQLEIQSHKRKALVLKREGKLAEAKEELKIAKLLEKRADNSSQSATPSVGVTVSKRADNSLQGTGTAISSAPSVERNVPSPSSAASKPLSSRERFKLQQESLGHKRQALKLRREGKNEEAEAEFELAKSLESQLQESTSPENSVSSKGADVDDANVEDFLDPQLLSALQSLGLQVAGTKSQSTGTPELAKTSQGNNTSVGLQVGGAKSQSTATPEPVKVIQDNTSNNSKQEREQLVERVKAEKVKAVSLKRAGKQAEAMDALRRAKLYEMKLESFTQN